MIYGSDKELFYITYTLEISGTATTTFGTDFYQGNLTIPHNLPYTPLVFALYSSDPDFTTYNMMDDIYDVFDPSPETGSSYAFSDQNNVEIYFITPKSKPTMYFRIFGFRNPDYTDPIEPKQVSEKWRFNTDLQYPQLVAFGGFTGDVYTHNLGFKPLALEWHELDDGLVFFAEISKITNTTITLRPLSGGNYSKYYLALFNQPGV